MCAARGVYITRFAPWVALVQLYSREHVWGTCNFLPFWGQTCQHVPKMLAVHMIELWVPAHYSRTSSDPYNPRRKEPLSSSPGLPGPRSALSLDPGPPSQGWCPRRAPGRLQLGSQRDMGEEGSPYTASQRTASQVTQEPNGSAVLPPARLPTVSGIMEEHLLQRFHTNTARTWVVKTEGCVLCCPFSTCLPAPSPDGLTHVLCMPGSSPHYASPCLLSWQTRQPRQQRRLQRSRGPRGGWG